MHASQQNTQLAIKPSSISPRLYSQWLRPMLKVEARRGRKLIKKYLNEMEALPLLQQGEGRGKQVEQKGHPHRNNLDFYFPLKLQKSHAMKRRRRRCQLAAYYIIDISLYIYCIYSIANTVYNNISLIIITCWWWSRWQWWLTQAKVVTFKFKFYFQSQTWKMPPDERRQERDSTSTIYHMPC